MLRQHSTSGRLRRQIAVAVGATALGGLPLLSGVAGAQTTPPVPPGAIDTSDLCVNVPAGFDPFSETDATFEADIACLALSGVTQGTGADTYSPGLTVRREQMATFIARLIDRADALEVADEIVALPAAPTPGQFTDIAASTQHAENIERLAAAGIVSGGVGGGPATSFSPGLPVSREQMATFINRAYNYMTGVTTPPPAAPDYYDDDEASVQHEAAINAITEAGIAQGSASRTFGPGNAVNRGQMAAFLVRTLAVVEADAAINPIAGPAVADETSGATSADNADGSATLTFTVETAEGWAIPGLDADDISMTVNGTPRTLTELLGNTAIWSNFVAGNGQYRIDFTPAAPGTSTFTDVTAGGVVIHPSLEVVVTNDDLQIPADATSGVAWEDNGDGSGTMTWTVEEADGTPITGLAAASFDFHRDDTDVDFNVGELLTTQPTLWSFAEIGDGVYEVTQISNALPQTRTYSALTVANVLVEASIQANIAAVAPPPPPAG